MGSGMRIQMKRNKVSTDVQKRTLKKFGFAGLEMPLQNGLSTKLSAAACARVVLDAKMNVDVV